MSLSAWREAAGRHPRFSDLGSGFRVAALDLEIRGAGNLLGGEQSGHIEAIGFEMYMKLLEQAVRELKGEEIEDEVRASVNLGIDSASRVFVPTSQRLSIHRRSETEIYEMPGARRRRSLPWILPWRLLADGRVGSVPTG
jgi:transcription-repair coupling factor (superfamily II helicase)